MVTVVEEAPATSNTTVPLWPLDRWSSGPRSGMGAAEMAKNQEWGCKAPAACSHPGDCRVVVVVIVVMVVVMRGVQDIAAVVVGIHHLVVVSVGQMVTMVVRAVVAIVMPGVAGLGRTSPPMR